ncbi:MAG TPA: hypothetical protein VLN49_09340 [Gemmatimonadaceae bacterium]|nr:hypothetical protein [Gemmatimonadaceae bacterium]
MSISGRIIPAIAALLLAGFANSTASAQAVHATASASMTDTMMVVKFDTTSVVNTCVGASGENVLLTGSQRFRIGWLERPNGTMLVLTISYSDMKGTGETTGDSYVMSGGYKDLVHLGTTTYSMNFTFREKLVDLGSGADMWMHLIENFSFDGTTLKTTVASAQIMCSAAGN